MNFDETFGSRRSGRTSRMVEQVALALDATKADGGKLVVLCSSGLMARHLKHMLSERGVNARDFMQPDSTIKVVSRSAAGELRGLHAPMIWFDHELPERIFREWLESNGVREQSR